MATYEPSDELSFEEFKQLMLSAPFELAGAMKEFADFHRAGSSEAEIKRWLTDHSWQFPQDFRHTIMRSFAMEMVDEAFAPGMIEAKIKREFLKLWESRRFEAAVAWARRQQPQRGRG